MRALLPRVSTGSEHGLAQPGRTVPLGGACHVSGGHPTLLQLIPSMDLYAAGVREPPGQPSLAFLRSAASVLSGPLAERRVAFATGNVQ